MLLSEDAAATFPINDHTCLQGQVGLGKCFCAACSLRRIEKNLDPPAAIVYRVPRRSAFGTAALVLPEQSAVAVVILLARGDRGRECGS